MKQGEIWIINLNPSKGAEIKKTRPGIIVNNDALGKLPLRVIVPLTGWKERYKQAPWMIKITADQSNKLKKTSAADCFQVRSISEKRFERKIGEINKKSLQEICEGLKKVFRID